MSVEGIYSVFAVHRASTRSVLHPIRYEITVKKPDDPAFGEIFSTLANFRAVIAQRAHDTGKLVRIVSEKTEFGPTLIHIETL